MKKNISSTLLCLTVISTMYLKGSSLEEHSALHTTVEDDDFTFITDETTSLGRESTIVENELATLTDMINNRDKYSIIIQDKKHKIKTREPLQYLALATFLVTGIGYTSSTTAPKTMLACSVASLTAYLFTYYNQNNLKDDLLHAEINKIRCDSSIELTKQKMHCHLQQETNHLLRFQLLARQQQSH